MKIQEAKYFSGCTSLEKCPQTEQPEFAFIGRSNVGKSSLINLLTQNKKLAMTSHQPGKTILINHFLINGQWFLVDLPGYGFAKRSKAEKERFQRMIRQYILGRKMMYNLFLLIDSNIPPQKIDLDFVQWLGEHGVPFSIVFTKTDKTTKHNTSAHMQQFKAILQQQWEQLPLCFQTSQVKGTGRDEILNYIEEILHSTRP